MSTNTRLDEEDACLALQILAEERLSLQQIAEHFRASPRALVRLLDGIQEDGYREQWTRLRSLCVKPQVKPPVFELPKLRVPEVKTKRLERNKGKPSRPKTVSSKKKKSGEPRKSLADLIEAIRFFVEEGWLIEQVCGHFETTEAELREAAKRAPPELRAGWDCLRAKLKSERARASVRAVYVKRENNDPDVQEKKTKFFEFLYSSMSIEKASQAAKVSVGIGKRWRREAGITKRQPPGKRELPAYQQALSVLAQGERLVDEVAEEFGLNSSELRGKCRRSKIAFRKEKSGPKKIPAVCYVTLVGKRVLNG